MSMREREGAETARPGGAAAERGAAGPRGAGAHLEIGPWVPLVALRVALVAAACVAFAVAPLPYALIAVALALVGAVLPASLLGWAAAFVIAMAQLAHPAAVADPRGYIALIAVHLLHVLAGLILVLPARGRLQVRALAVPARRWLIIEVVAQPVLALALWARAGHVGGAIAGGAVAVAAALCALAMVIALARLARRR